MGLVGLAGWWALWRMRPVGLLRVGWCESLRVGLVGYAVLRVLWHAGPAGLAQGGLVRVVKSGAREASGVAGAIPT